MSEKFAQPRIMKPIFEQLSPGLLARSKNLSVLTQLLTDCLPGQVHGHFHVVKLDQHTLFIVTDSPVWATRLRQLAPQLINHLRINRSGQKHHKYMANINLQTLIPAGIRHIQVLTRPGQLITTPCSSPEHHQNYPRQLSPQAGKLLSQSADYINDGKLSESLRKLSRHCR